MDLRPDNVLLQKFVNNADDRAFTELVERHGGMVFNAAYSILENKQDAEDVTQAVFITLAKKAESLKKSSTIPGWLYHVSRNAALDWLRSEKRRRRREREAEQMKAKMSTAPDTDRELGNIVRDALDTLPEKYSTPLIMHHMEGRTHAEAAATLGITENAFSARLTRAREYMRKKLQRQNIMLSTALPLLGLGKGISTELSATVIQSIVLSVKAAKLGTAAGAAAGAGSSASASAAGTGVASSATTSQAAASAAHVAKIVKGVEQMLFIAKIKTATTCALTAAALTFGTGAAFHLAASEAKPQKQLEKKVEIAPAVTNAASETLSFENDPAVLGDWESVDFVSEIDNFSPDTPSFRGEFFLKRFSFKPNGRTQAPWWTWEKGKVFHKGNKTTANYTIKNIKGKDYLFLEWMSGDVTIRGMKPKYYVLCRLEKTHELKKDHMEVARKLTNGVFGMNWKDVKDNTTATATIKGRTLAQVENLFRRTAHLPKQQDMTMIENFKYFSWQAGKEPFANDVQWKKYLEDFKFGNEGHIVIGYLPEDTRVTVYCWVVKRENNFRAESWNTAPMLPCIQNCIDNPKDAADTAKKFMIGLLSNNITEVESVLSPEAQLDNEMTGKEIIEKMKKIQTNGKPWPKADNDLEEVKKARYKVWKAGKEPFADNPLWQTNVIRKRVFDENTSLVVGYIPDPPRRPFFCWVKQEHEQFKVVGFSDTHGSHKMVTQYLDGYEERKPPVMQEPVVRRIEDTKADSPQNAIKSFMIALLSGNRQGVDALATPDAIIDNHTMDEVYQRIEKLQASKKDRLELRQDRIAMLEKIKFATWTIGKEPFAGNEEWAKKKRAYKFGDTGYLVIGYMPGNIRMTVYSWVVETDTGLKVGGWNDSRMLDCIKPHLPEFKDADTDVF